MSDPSTKKKSAQKLQKEIKVVVHIPDKISDRVRHRKINQIYDILANKQSTQKQSGPKAA